MGTPTPSIEGSTELWVLLLFAACSVLSIRNLCLRRQCDVAGIDWSRCRVVVRERVHIFVAPSSCHFLLSCLVWGRIH